MTLTERAFSNAVNQLKGWQERLKWYEQGQGSFFDEDVPYEIAEARHQVITWRRTTDRIAARLARHYGQLPLP